MENDLGLRDLAALVGMDAGIDLDCGSCGIPILVAGFEEVRENE